MPVTSVSRMTRPGHLRDTCHPHRVRERTPIEHIAQWSAGRAEAPRGQRATGQQRGNPVSTTPSRRRRILALAGTGAMLAAGLGALSPGAALASSHREAPLIAGDPRADNTDTYAFVSPDKPDTVTLLANWYPFEEPNGGPNFYPFATHARYIINIDNNGDGHADVVYTWQFVNHIRNSAGTFLYNTGVVNHLTDPTLNYYQTYTLTETRHGASTVLLRHKFVAPSTAGPKSMPDYATLRDEAIAQGTFAGGKTYVGQADDPFFLDLRVFDLLYGADLSETGQDTLDGYNVDTIALQVPKSDLAQNRRPGRNPVIGVWSTTDRRATTSYSTTGATASGRWVQVSRLGNPLVNEAVVPLKYKDAFNGLSPSQDHLVTPVVDKVKDPIVPHLIQSIYNIPAPSAPRNDLVEIFLTGLCKACGPIQADLNSQRLNAGVDPAKFVPSEELRLNMSVPPTASPKRLGVLAGDLQGFPNGRRLTDDVIDIELQALEGAAQSGTLVPGLTDAVDANDVAFDATFPYVALPHSGAVNHAGTPAAAAAIAGDNSSSGTFGGVGTTKAAILAGLGAALLMAGVAGMRRRRGPLAGRIS